MKSKLKELRELIFKCEEVKKDVLELKFGCKLIDKFDYEDLIEFEEYFYGTWVNDLEEYLEENYQPLEEITIDSEISRIDREITMATIAQIYMMLYVMENSQEPLTEEEQFVYDLYSSLRDMLYNELGE
jgi:hypothetical protein